MFRMYSHVWERGGASMHGPGYLNADKGDKPWLREFILREHSGDWFAAIADSGKKHVVPFATLNPPGRSGVVMLDDLPVMVPDDTALTPRMCALLTAGPSKAEIEAGQYAHQNYARCMRQILEFEELHAAERGGAWFRLSLWLSQRDETITAARVAAEKEAHAERKGKRAPRNANRGGDPRSSARVSPAGREGTAALGSTPRSATDRSVGVGEPKAVSHSDGGPSRRDDSKQGHLPGID
jgi:hypothetical protein